MGKPLACHSADPVASVAIALRRAAGGIAVVYYPDFGLREWAIAEVASLLPGEALRAADVAAALAASPDEAVLLIPSNERLCVEDLAGCRDQFLEPERSQPIVLFLMRDGAGKRALADHAGLASWIRGNDPDPDELSAIDVESERARFLEQHDRTPEQWLVEWKERGEPRSREEHSRPALP